MSPARRNEAEELSTVIGHVYDASLDPSLWSGALRRSAIFLESWAAGLIAKDPVNRSGVFYVDDGVMERRYVQLYFDKYVSFDPTNVAHYFGEIDEPVTVPQIMPYEEMYETRIHKEWAAPQGIIDFASTVLDKSETSAAIFGVFRHERNGIVNADMCRRMRLIAPHIRRAVLISRAVQLKTVQAENLTETLDALSAGMFLIGADGRIVHTNAAGHAMLAEGSALRTAGGRLVASDSDADQTLKDVFAAANLGDNAVGTNGISVSLTKGSREQLVAHALPLTSGTRRDTGNAYKAATVLFVQKATIDRPAPPEIIAKTFDLTASELRVLLAVVEVGGVMGIAEALGISENTVKTHLKRLYRKTGANRQADLVKLVAKFSSPLVR